MVALPRIVPFASPVELLSSSLYHIDFDFDYDEFFRAFARQYAEQTTEENELDTMKSDMHPLPFHRVNIVLQQFDEFIETYDIKPGDGMYLSPEKRVNVW